MLTALFIQHDQGLHAHFVTLQILRKSLGFSSDTATHPKNSLKEIILDRVLKELRYWASGYIPFVTLVLVPEKLTYSQKSPKIQTSVRLVVVVFDGRRVGTAIRSFLMFWRETPKELTVSDSQIIRKRICLVPAKKKHEI